MRPAHVLQASLYGDLFWVDGITLVIRKLTAECLAPGLKSGMGVALANVVSCASSGHSLREKGCVILGQESEAVSSVPRSGQSHLSWMRMDSSADALGQVVLNITCWCTDIRNGSYWIYSVFERSQDTHHEHEHSPNQDHCLVADET